MLHDHRESENLAEKDARMYLAGADQFGRYGYNAASPARQAEWVPHNSTSQYGVLGMWACNQLGVEIPADYWQAVIRGWNLIQAPDGGWCYFSQVPTNTTNFTTETPAMTAAGVASLLVARDAMDVTADCAGNVDSPQVDKGLDWLANHLDNLRTSYERYGVERIGVLSGAKYIGRHDWYREIADAIVAAQAPNGNWPDTLGFPLADVSLNLAFLARGQAPVLMNKLSYHITENGKRRVGTWNQRPCDVFNLMNWMSDQLETDFNWQLLDMDACDIDDLHDAPILYISGGDRLSFTPEELRKLRQFVDEGGMIVGNADGGGERFTRSFKKLGSQLFGSYEFRMLPESHPIYRNEQFAPRQGETMPRVMGLSNGVRELMLLPEADLSAAFQTRAFNTRRRQFELADDRQNAHRATRSGDQGHARDQDRACTVCQQLGSGARRLAAHRRDPPQPRPRGPGHPCRNLGRWPTPEDPRHATGDQRRRPSRLRRQPLNPPGVPVHRRRPRQTQRVGGHEGRRDQGRSPGGGAGRLSRL
jgi:hypothetical protein